MGTVSLSTGQEASAIVAIAAESREFDGLLRHARSGSSVELDVDFARSAEISGHRWLLAANGPGHDLASRAMRAVLRVQAARAVVSTGFCGALDPALRAADVVVATEVWSGTNCFRAEAPGSGQAAARGAVVSQDRVATTAGEKAALRARGAAAVEMEAGAVASMAQDLGLPFYCIRVVSDEASASLPLDFNRFRNSRGDFDRGRIARAAALRPWTWPGLIHLSRNCRRASVTLGDFLADCRF
ncbi:MAG: hypothetical protein IT161_14920 [Bryobacterales bacterium]|nr:hypothetical protein [Bryobacterales bacterium]